MTSSDGLLFVDDVDGSDGGGLFWLVGGRFENI